MQICKDERKVWFQIRILSSVIIIVIILSLLSNCGYGIYYRIKKGETIDDVARKYNVKKEDIIEANKNLSVDKLKEGDYVYIPLDKQHPQREEKTTENNRKEENENIKKYDSEVSKNKVFKVSIPHSDFQERLTSESNEKKNGVKLNKPIAEKRIADKKLDLKKLDRSKDNNIDFIVYPPIEGGQIISNFGMRNGRMHKGIDIKAPEGSPIKSAQDGVVVFSGFIRGYGNAVILKHEGDYFTVYAHNKYNTVKEGEFVKRGSVLGYVGMTGNADTPHLHFEVRKRTNALNPLLFFENKSALK